MPLSNFANMKRFEEEKLNIFRCRCCGIRGTLAKTRYDFSKNTIGPITIYIGTVGYGNNVLCCQNCASIGRLWSHIGTGFHSTQDYILCVQKRMGHSAKVTYIYHQDNGEAYDSMAPIKKEKYFEHRSNSWESYSIPNWKYYRQMSDGECVELPAHSDKKYTKPFSRLDTFTGYSWKPFTTGMVVMNTNDCFDNSGARVDNCNLVKLIGKDSEGNWIGIDYNRAYSRAITTVVNWWRKQAARYYGPKPWSREDCQVTNEIYKTHCGGDRWRSCKCSTKNCPHKKSCPCYKCSPPQEREITKLKFKTFYRILGFQSTKDCKGCSGFTTNEEIAKGAKCILCTHYKIDESYCSICDNKKTDEGTLGCPGCWKLPCKRCKTSNHINSKCPFRNVKGCEKCKAPGHNTKDCPRRF